GELRAEPGPQGEGLVAPLVAFGGELVDVGQLLHDQLLRGGLLGAGIGECTVLLVVPQLQAGDEGVGSVEEVTQSQYFVGCPVLACGPFDPQVCDADGHEVGEGHGFSRRARMRSVMYSPNRRRKTVPETRRPLTIQITAPPDAAR